MLPERAMAVTIYLGTHQPAWLERTTIPLFVSRRRLEGRKRLPRAAGIWALDSGGFTELSHFGEWRTPPEKYVDEVRRFREEIGGMQWAAIQDWMCEPFITAKTGLTVEEHQRRTVLNYLLLRRLAPEVPWAPVLQGWLAGDYFEHWRMYELEGIDLRAAPVVGVGSVCRRQHTLRAEMMMRDLAGAGLRLHGFGFKVKGLRRVADVLASSDSLAWSFAARREAPLPECRERHQNCANCFLWASRWYDDLAERLRAPERQLPLLTYAA